MNKKTSKWGNSLATARCQSFGQYMANTYLFDNTWQTLICLTIHGKHLFVWQYMANTYLFDNTWQTLICLTIHGKHLFVWQYMANTNLFDNTWQTLICLTIHGKHLFVWQYMPNTYLFKEEVKHTFQTVVAITTIPRPNKRKFCRESVTVSQNVVKDSTYLACLQYWMTQFHICDTKNNQKSNWTTVPSLHRFN